MTSIRSLANYFCARCQEITMHRADRCIHCSTRNTTSGPAPRQPSNYGQKADSAARRIEGLAARNRARAARNRWATVKARPT